MKEGINMSNNDQEFLVQKIRTQYTEKQHTELDALKALDVQVKKPANVFGYTYGSIGAPSLTGVLDGATLDSLSSFQMLIGLPVTGALDKHTWKHLALHFPLAANLGRGQPQSAGRKNIANL